MGDDLAPGDDDIHSGEESGKGNDKEYVACKSAFYKVRQKIRTDQDDSHYHHGYEIGDIRLGFARDFIPVEDIFQKQGYGNRFDNDRFQQYKDQVQQVDLPEFNEGHAEQQESLDGDDLHIGHHAVCDNQVDQGDGECDQENVCHGLCFT